MDSHENSLPPVVVVLCLLVPEGGKGSPKSNESGDNIPVWRGKRSGCGVSPYKKKKEKIGNPEDRGKDRFRVPLPFFSRDVIGD